MVICYYIWQLFTVINKTSLRRQNEVAILYLFCERLLSTEALSIKEIKTIQFNLWTQTSIKIKIK